MFLSSRFIDCTELIEQHSYLVVIMSHSLCNCMYLSVCVCVCVCAPFVRVYLAWQYWQIKFKMRFVCQTSDMSIIYRFIALLHFNSDLILFLCTISILAHATCPEFAMLLLQYTTLSACHMYFIVLYKWDPVGIITGNANGIRYTVYGIRYNGLAVKLEIDDALQLNSFNIEFNSALKTK